MAGGMGAILRAVAAVVVAVGSSPTA
jgi:hypothetical protein